MWRRTEPDRRMQEDYYLMGSYGSYIKLRMFICVTADSGMAD